MLKSGLGRMPKRFNNKNVKIKMSWEYEDEVRS